MTEKKYYKCKAGLLRFASGCDIETPSPRNQRCSACNYLERSEIDASLDSIYESYSTFEKGLVKHTLEVYDSFNEHEKKVVRKNVYRVWNNTSLNNEMIEATSCLLMGMKRRLMFVYEDRIEVNSKDSIKGT